MSQSSFKFISPDWGAPSNVKALVTTRQGGVSITPFDSLNLGLHVDDKLETVMENRRLLREAAELPNEPIWLNQTHSTDIVTLPINPAIQHNNFDGALAREKNSVCVVMTADCLPLFLSSEDGKQVGVLHVGWRGLADGIIKQGVALFDCDPKHILAWAGPCISQAHFEIGEDVKELLRGPESAYYESQEAGRYYADMVALTGQILAECGVSKYSYSDYCSYRDEELFYSYRREGITGRMASLIWIE